MTTGRINQVAARGSVGRVATTGGGSSGKEGLRPCVLSNRASSRSYTGELPGREGYRVVPSDLFVYILRRSLVYGRQEPSRRARPRGFSLPTGRGVSIPDTFFLIQRFSAQVAAEISRI